MNDLARSPDLYPQKLDLVREAAMVVALNAQAYRAASFLDDRLLTPGMKTAWLPLADLAAAARNITNQRPLHFIFHAGHVGSTLLSRVLDDTGSVLGLREPLPLRTLADASDVLDAAESLLSETQFDALLRIILRLWSRGYPETRSVVVKATSIAARLGPRLLAAEPEARAVYLNLPPEPYLATLLAGPSAVFDLRGFGAERMRRLHRLAGETATVLHKLSPGRLAAMAWLTERLTQERISAAAGNRLLKLDFDELLAHRGDAIAQVLRHFALESEPHVATRLANSAVFTRYSKAPDQYAYGDALRTQALTQARRDHAAEISGGLAWLERLGANNAVIAAVL